ncbi:MAG: DUF1203 domain-containing protein [Chthoniobacterales bacterium]
MTTSNFRIVPLPTDVADAARDAIWRGAPGHAIVDVDLPNAYPCRHCLRWAQPGERVILFTYASIGPGRPYAESGPIFVHEQPCQAYSATYDYPVDFRNGRVVRAYDVGENMVDAVVVNGEEPEAIIARLLARPETAFLQVRSVTRGCFTFKIERA